ncbi:MAG: histidine--tRNA ligase [Burkholderiaceae bacterium]|nr:histidine--tRNA ligase [Burkholderiaceae bacterium]
MSKEKLTGVKGMNDLLPDQSGLWQWVESRVAEVFHQYGYREIRTPIVEPTALFVRGIGEVTDIVEKEMYTFIDSLNGEQLTLRPENTAAVVRSVIEHNLLYDGPKRLWYTGPMFRHERPQRGRYRQFHQFGIEALGLSGPDIDAEQLLMIARLWQALGLTGENAPRLEINSLGQKEERLAHRAALIAHFEKHASALDEDAKRRLHSNPLRILDSKNPAMRPVVESAPLLKDFLGEASQAHFNAVLAILDAHKINTTINPRLVRGLDYYNLTVFEWITDKLGAQGTVCGGGRYDTLIEQMGGKPAPACGFAIGVERLVELIKELAQPQIETGLHAYIVHWGEGSVGPALAVAEQCRGLGLAVQVHFGEGGLKSQMKKADQSGAKFAVLMGDDERIQGVATIKSLRVESGQQTVAMAEVGSVIAGNSPGALGAAQ